MLALATVVYGLNRYGITVDNAVALAGALYNIFTQTELSADPTYERQLLWWERAFKWLSEQAPVIRGVLYVLVAAVFVAVAVFAPEALLYLCAIAAKAAISGFIIGGAIGGLMAAVTGGSVWKGILEGAIYGALDGAAIAVIIFGIVKAAKAIANAVKAANVAKAQRAIQAADAVQAQQAAAQPVTKPYELNSQSYTKAADGNPSFNTFRERYWIAEANRIPELYKDNVTAMLTGKAPVMNGEKLVLHHIVGRGELYNVVVLPQ